MYDRADITKYVVYSRMFGLSTVGLVRLLSGTMMNVDLFG